MADQGGQRRLAAIFSADMVGYSRLMDRQDGVGRKHDGEGRQGHGRVFPAGHGRMDDRMGDHHQLGRERQGHEECRDVP